MSEARTRFRLTRPEPPESAVLAACLRALELHPRVAWACRVNSGAMTGTDANGKRRFIRFNGMPGMSDIIGQTRNGTFLAVECKRPSGRLTDDQRAFLDRVQAAGGVAVCARSVDDVIAALGEA